jgi:hypothetical protein
MGGCSKILVLERGATQAGPSEYVAVSLPYSQLSTFFHPVYRIMFWHSDNNFYNIAGHVQKGEEAFLADPKHAKISDEDRELLHQAFVHMQVLHRTALSSSLTRICANRIAAYEDNDWREIQAHLDVFYRVEGMSEVLYRTWSPLTREGYVASTGGYIHAERLLKLRELVNTHPLASEARLKDWGEDAARDEKRRNELYFESLKKRKRRKGKDDADILTEAEKTLTKRVEGNRESSMMTGDSFGDRYSREAAQTGPERSDLLVFSPLARVMIGSSTSPKLNYVLAEVSDKSWHVRSACVVHESHLQVRNYASEEKFLIFSNSPLTLAHVAEGLNLIGVKYLLYTSQVKAKEREQQVLTFETSDLYRVFLMELKHGARGLYVTDLHYSAIQAQYQLQPSSNLVTASRVIFCEPVWKADTESQSIKVSRFFTRCGFN